MLTDGQQRTHFGGSGPLPGNPLFAPCHREKVPKTDPVICANCLVFTHTRFQIIKRLRLAFQTGFSSSAFGAIKQIVLLKGMSCVVKKTPQRCPGACWEQQASASSAAADDDAGAGAMPVVGASPAAEARDSMKALAHQMKMARNYQVCACILSLFI